MAKAETAVYGGVQAAFSSNKALAKAVAAVFPSEGVRLPINFHGAYIHYRQAWWEGRPLLATAMAGTAPRTAKGRQLPLVPAPPLPPLAAASVTTTTPCLPAFHLCRSSPAPCSDTL
jgi:hypothetical protein